LGSAIAGFAHSPMRPFRDCKPWDLTLRSEALVQDLLAGLDDGYDIVEGIATHRTASIETGAVVKAPAIIGPGCFIAAGAYVRQGCWLEADCILGPGAELKSSLLFRGTKLAHFNFVGDSILGAEVNLEAGSIIANYRNEDPGNTICFLHDGVMMDTGVSKFGALVADGVRIGANAVVAPGAILSRGMVVGRLALVDRRGSPGEDIRVPRRIDR